MNVMPNEISSYYARTIALPSGQVLPEDDWQLLEDHLQSVADLVESFAAKFDASMLGSLIGLWHDLGKYQQDFQKRLHESAEGKKASRVNHAAVGAYFSECLLSNKLGYYSWLISIPIASHHAGLPENKSHHESRLVSSREAFRNIIALAKRSCEKSNKKGPANLQTMQRILTPPNKSISIKCLEDLNDSEQRILALEFLSRMLFSSLVDADRLDAEAFQAKYPENDDISIRERYPFAKIPNLRRRIDDFIDGMVSRRADHEMSDMEKEVFKYRQAVLGACRKAAEQRPGAFALEVETGGGKTLSSLSFALRHAEKYGKDRVVIVIPYLSIIEQTAEQIRTALGDLQFNLVEHHSGVVEDGEEEDEVDPKALRRRLATDNWDAPIIVTTGVQFFESLLAYKPAKCRKIHNIANSVVIIDEAQTLPPKLLNPSVWIINELVRSYKTTVVLSTATQPSLKHPFPEIHDLYKIMPERAPKPPRRATMEVLDKEIECWAELAEALLRYPKVLCITHLRNDARDLTLALDESSRDSRTIHLSAAMCPKHRTKILKQIKYNLVDSSTCRLISTQLIEAGVDIDFPVVFRSMAGVASLVQAAGRANREGKLGVCGGKLVVYKAPTMPPPGLPRLAAEAAEKMLKSFQMDGRSLDIFDPKVGEQFFRSYYSKIDDKDNSITNLRLSLHYKETSTRYRFIESNEIGIVIPYDEIASKLIKELCTLGPSKTRLRKLQIYTVQIYPIHLSDQIDQNILIPLLPNPEGTSRLYYLNPEYKEEFYSERFGLCLGNLENYKPRELII